MGFLNRKGEYYEGDRQGNDISVPAPPSPTYTYDAETEEWVEDPEKVRLSIKAGLKESDQGAIRIIEDLITVLVDKGILSSALTELPEAVRTKIGERMILRNALNE